MRDQLIDILQTIRTFLGVHKRAVIRGSVLVLAVLFISWAYINYAFVYISATKIPQNIKSSSLYAHANSDYSTTKIGTGVQIIPRSTKSITVSANDNIRTQVPVSIPWYGFSSVTAELRVDVNADKYAFNSTFRNPCAAYNPDSEKLLTYDCLWPSTLVQYETPTNSYWKNSVVNKIEYADNHRAASYRGGLLGITNEVDADRALRYYDGQGGDTPINVPADVDPKILRNSDVFTDTSDPDENRFVFVTSVGDIYVGTPKANNLSSIEYVKFPAPPRYSERQQTLCSISSGNFHCYRGSAKIGDTPVDEQEKPSIIGGALDSTKSETYSVDRNYIDSFYTTENGEFYAIDASTLYSLKKVGTSYHAIKTIPDVKGAATTNESLYVIQKNGVYKMEEGVLYQVFYSSNITTKSLYVIGSRIFVLGSVANQRDTTFAYLLNQSPDTTPGKRLIDLYPSSLPQLSMLHSQDMVGNRLYASLYQSTNDPSRIPALREQSISTIEALGINIDAVKLELMY